MKRMALLLILLLAAGFAGIQLYPYGRDRVNPPVSAEPRWDTLRTRDLAKRACFDCHSNETVWPWYSRVAPVSWFIQWDVEKGRWELNFSEWDRPQEEAEESAGKVREGKMPPGYYTFFRSETRLSPAERGDLVRGLEATFLRDRGGRGAGEEREEHERKEKG